MKDFDEETVEEFITSDNRLTFYPPQEPQDENQPKSKEYPAEDIVREFQTRCKAIRYEIPKGWGARICGSIRRQWTMVHDLDVVVLVENLKIEDAIKHRFETMVFDWHFDFRICHAENLGAMLLYLTGDRNHNVMMRIHAKKMGLMLNEYGLFGKEEGQPKYLCGETEKEIYTRLGLLYLVPKQRSFRLFHQAKLEEIK